METSVLMRTSVAMGTSLAETFADISFSLAVRDLGVTLDREPSFSQHGYSVARAAIISFIGYMYLSAPFHRMQMWFLFMPLLLVELIIAARF